MSDPTINHDPLLNRKQAARYIGGYSPSTLEVWASRGQGPAFIKFGPNGRVRYRQSVLDAFLESQFVRKGGEAKQIPIADLLARLGAEPARQGATQSWYLSPLRKEKRPSFHVHTGKNCWYDFGQGRGGSVIDLAIAYLEASGRHRQRMPLRCFPI